MIKVQKITKRWLLRSFAIIVVTLVSIEALVIALTSNSYYHSAKQAVLTRASVLKNTLDSYSTNANIDFAEQTRLLIENFSERDKMELLAIDRNEKPTMSSSGFQPQLSTEMPDLVAALKSDSGIGQAMMTHTNGEDVFCVTIASPSPSGDILALRLMASLEPAKSQVLRLALMYILIGFAIVGFILLSNLIFLQSIVKPVIEVEKTARRIAGGDFEVRIDNKYKDEMGDLCEIINYMADEL
ncbi:MAG: HAMP domain-containing protein, partial [Oscillospiraceae bacterium]|nr:HAMP domain-containing protein [Oscillospiraceae bacterium]